VHVPLLQTFDDQIDLYSIFRNAGAGDGGSGLIDLRAAVKASVMMGVSLHHEGVRAITGSERTRCTSVDSRITRVGDGLELSPRAEITVMWYAPDFMNASCMRELLRQLQAQW
jgi:hypothetical protein